MQCARISEIQEILDYLRPNVHDCLYMYVDIKKYGLDGNNIKIWIDRDHNDKIELVLMKYHTSMTLYSLQDDIDLAEAANLIKKYKPLSITGRRTLIESLAQSLENIECLFYGYVMKLVKYPDFGGDKLIETAGEKDMFEIAELITSDHDIGSYYDVEDLAIQLIERMRDHMGRNLVIRDGGGGGVE